MELQFEFEKPNEITDIRNELKNIITNFFKDSINPDCESVISRYSIVYEITTYIFESYRKVFESNIRSSFRHTVITESYLEVRRKTFILGITLDVLIALGRSKLLNPTTLTPQLKIE